MTSASKDVSNFTSTCTIAGVEGVDNPQNTETSSTTNASLTLGTNSAITINNGGTLAVDSISIPSGSISIQAGGQIKLNTPLYVADADADGYAVGFTLYTASASGRRRLGLMRNFTTVDCGDASYSTANSCYMTATGGTITTSGNYKIHTFTSGGTFTVGSNPGNVAALVVAGGGGGGGGSSSGFGAGGGGGGGSVKYNAAYAASGSITVTVGNGGAGGDCVTAAGCGAVATSGYNGQNSVFGTITAVGGGYGGSVHAAGGSGGNGGGGGQEYYPGGGSNDGGYSGGTGGACNPTCASAGGGGAGANGQTVTQVKIGRKWWNWLLLNHNWLWSLLWWWGWRGAYFGTPGSGGNGGGGTGSAGDSNPAYAATANTGGGGGGGGYRGHGGAGGSGVVIIKYQFQ